MVADDRGDANGTACIRSYHDGGAAPRRYKRGAERSHRTTVRPGAAAIGLFEVRCRSGIPQKDRCDAAGRSFGSEDGASERVWQMIRRVRSGASKTTAANSPDKDPAKNPGMAPTGPAGHSHTELPQRIGQCTPRNSPPPSV